MNRSFLNSPGRSTDDQVVGKLSKKLRVWPRALPAQLLYPSATFILVINIFVVIRKRKTVPDRALEIVPGDVGTRVQRALVELNWRAEPETFARNNICSTRPKTSLPF